MKDGEGWTNQCPVNKMPWHDAGQHDTLMPSKWSVAAIQPEWAQSWKPDNKDNSTLVMLRGPKPIWDVHNFKICLWDFKELYMCFSALNNGQCFTVSLNILTVWDILAHSSCLVGITLHLFQCFNVQIDFLPSRQAEHLYLLARVQTKVPETWKLGGENGNPSK